MRVTFDGTTKLTNKSPLPAILRDPISKITNRDEFIESIHKLDTEEGRKILKLIFDDELLEHERAGIDKKLPSGQVIEPTTVALVIVVSLIIAATAVITTQIVLHGPVKLSLRYDAAPVGPKAFLEFEPARF